MVDTMVNKTLLNLCSVIEQKGLDAYLVPRADTFFGEEVRLCDERLKAVSGFGGSAGLAVIMSFGPHILLVDGRYVLQATESFSDQPWEVHEGGLSLMAGKLASKKVGYDPWLFTTEQLSVLSGAHLIPLPDNLVDQAWDDRPSFESMDTFELAADVVGEVWTDKCSRILAQCDGNNLLVTQPDALAWLANKRGSDLVTTPVQVAFGLLKVGGHLEIYLPEDRDALLTALSMGPIQFDPASTCEAIVKHLGDRGIPKSCPIKAAKAIKNIGEIEAIRAAHSKDGKALTAFIDWFEEQDKPTLTELDLVTKLAEFRRQSNDMISPSFDTICGSGPNGALPHYRVSETSNRQLVNGDLIVLDSGAQYPGATTDVTRTLAVGEVSDERRNQFTLVLKGMIALTLQQFPVGTTGHQLDVVARIALWNERLNYNHGTGHGVGAGLGVHESPPRLSAHPNLPVSEWALKPGMILSNEPGFYQEGSHGIRSENLLLVIEISPGWLGFETLTKAPFDESLIVWELLSPKEAAWLKNYQADLAGTLAR